MSGAMGWFRSSAFVTVLVGLRYFSIHLSVDARLAGDLSLIGKWFGWWLLVWLVAVIFIYALPLPPEGIFDNLWFPVAGVSIVVIFRSSLVVPLYVGPQPSNAPPVRTACGGRSR